MAVTLSLPAARRGAGDHGEDGTQLVHHTEGRWQWTGTLPGTQDYLIGVVSVGGATRYSLTVESRLAEPEPTRIRFAPGATSATVSGSLAPNGSQTYVLRAMRQLMDVLLTSPSGDLLLGIWGADGSVLKHNAVAGYDWAGRLASTQDYFIGIVSNGPAANYQLTVTITQYDMTPTRIQFRTRATSATVLGQIAAGGIDRYVLRALAGQTMESCWRRPVPPWCWTFRGRRDTLLASG